MRVRRSVIGTVLMTACGGALVPSARADPLSRPWGQQKIEESDTDEERLRGEELEQAIPDLEVQTSLPALVFYPFFSVRVPFQPLGVGAELDWNALSWLRFSLLYSFGISPGEDEMLWSHYAEAFVGLRVVGWSSESRVDIDAKRGRSAGREPIKAFLPAHHGFYLEGGAVTGFLQLRRCSAECEPEVDQGQFDLVDLQPVMPAAGVRYVYLSRASSRARDFTRSYHLQIFAHLLFAPLNEAEFEILDRSNDPLETSAIGGRVGIDLPPFGRC